MNGRTGTTLAWMVPIALVALLLGVETDWGRSPWRETPPREVVTPQPVKVALLPEFSLDGGPEARRETVERTLFNPTRRPAPPAPAANAAASAMKRGQFTLTGTTVVDGKATAFLREVSGGKARQVRKGESIDGMLVEQVLPDRVRLSMNGETEDLTMKVATGPKSTVQPVQPGAIIAPHAATVPGAQPLAQGATEPAGAQDVASLLAQRRRAARAAAAANAVQPGAAPVAAVPTAPATPNAPPAAPAAGGSSGDPAWNAVYQRMLQQQRK